LLTSFYLVLWFEMNTILSVMVAALIIAGFSAIFVDRRDSSQHGERAKPSGASL
jgi:hypothetical protein